MFLMGLTYYTDFETKSIRSIIAKMSPILHQNLFSKHHTEITVDVNGVSLKVGLIYYMDPQDLVIEFTDESQVALPDEEDVILRIQTTSTLKRSRKHIPEIIVGMEYWVRPKGENDFTRLPEYDDNRAFLNALGPAY